MHIVQGNPVINVSFSQHLDNVNFFTMFCTGPYKSLFKFNVGEDYYFHVLCSWITLHPIIVTKNKFSKISVQNKRPPEAKKICRSVHKSE